MPELGDFEGAVERSATVDETGSRVPPTWEARYLLALAQTHAELGRDTAAVTSLSRARSVTPEWIRYHRLVRDLTLELRGRLGPGRHSELDELTTHLHLAAA